MRSRTSSQSRLSGPVKLLLIGLGCLALGAGEDDAVARDRARLLAMPLALRRRLWDNLQTFQKLDAPTRDAVRALDRAVNAKTDAERAQYYAAARRYHVWLRGLDPDTRAKIDEAPRNTEARLKAVSAVLARIGNRARPADRPPILRMLDLRSRSPFELAFDIKVWQALDAAQRDEVLQTEFPAQREARLAAFARKLKIEEVKTPTPAERVKLYERVAAGLKNNNIPSDLASFGVAPEVAEANPQMISRMRTFVADNFYFREHPPHDSVHPDRLVRFMEAMPDWIRGRIEPLSPTEARRRLTILYRIVYPAPAEIPVPKIAAEAKAAAQAAGNADVKAAAPGTKNAAPKAVAPPQTPAPSATPNPTQRIF